MRNLVLYSISSQKYNKSGHAVAQSLVVEKNIFILYKPTEISQHVAVYNSETDKSLVVALRDGVYSNMEYLIFDDLVFLTVRNKLSFMDSSLNTVKTVTLDGGNNITHTKWNGPQDMLAVFFDNSCMALYMINAFAEEATCIGQTNLEDVPIEHIDVGWGGSHKYKRSQVASSSYVCDSQEPVIDWNGNGESFAINYFDGYERVIKVYTNKCELLYSSKTIQSGLEPLLAYKPIGNLVACVTSTDGQDQQLCMMEKNCLTLSMIPLETGAKAIKLLWSPCSTCITVLLKKNNSMWIDMYIAQNCEYLLKQRLPLNETNVFVDYAMKPMVSGLFNLELHFEKGYHAYTFIQKFIRSNVQKLDYGLNLNIECNTLRCYYFATGLSSFNDEAHYIHKHTCPINAVAFSESSYMIMFVDADNIIFIYDYTQRYCWDLMHTIELPKSAEQIPLSTYKLFMPKNNTLCVACYTVNSEDELYTYDLTTVEPTYIMNSTKKHILTFSSVKEGESSFYYTDYNRTPIIELYNVCVSGSYHTLYMTVDGGFFIDHQRAKDKVSSMFVYGNRLTVTAINNESDLTSTDNVYGVYLTSEVIETLKDGGSFDDVSYKRTVEQGSVVLNTIDKYATTILLLPRGNIESVELRNIALFIVRDKLLNQKYIDALEYIKKQSLRLDLVVDLSPVHFFANKVRLFHSLDHCACLNKFFVDLKNESSLNEQEIKLLGVEDQLEDKVVKVARSFEDVYLQLRHADKHLMTYALALYFSTKNIFDTMVKMSNVTSTLSFKIEDLVKAIEVLSNHVDKKELYNASLFTFNVQLAELVASQSQMDPCVYQPFIRRVTSMEFFEGRFTICCEVGRMKEALFYQFQRYRQENITGVEIIRFATESDLVGDLYDMVDVSDEIFEEAAILYYDVLQNAHNYLEAGILINRLQRHAEAVTVLLKGFHWQEALTVIDASDSTPADSINLYREVAHTLSAHGNHVDAANILVLHCNEYDAALQSFINGKEFELALRLSRSLNSPNVHQMIIENMVIECQNLCTRTQDLSNTFTRYHERLKVVRQKLQTEAEAGLLQDSSNMEFSDAMSVTTAGTSISTRSRSTNRSNRSVTRRLKKEQKKYMRLKENSRYEDIALLYNLSVLVDDVKSIQKAVNELYRTIQLRNLDIPDIVTPCELIDELVKHVNTYTSEIWPDHFATYEPKDSDNGIYTNLVHLDYRYRMKPELQVTSQERATINFLKRR